MNPHLLPSLAALETLAAASVDAVVAFPPRDTSPVTREEFARLLDEKQSLEKAGPRSSAAWRACSRVLKPGGHAVVAAFGRDMDIIGMALRCADFEMRDSIFVPHERGQFPVLVARSKLGAKTIVENVRRYGAGALNLGATRVKPSEDEVILGIADEEGRWPANLIHDGSVAIEEAMRARRRESSKAHVFNSLAMDADADGLAVALARHLTRLTVPPGGVILDPFAATDVVGRAATSLGVKAVLVDYRTQPGGRAAESSPGG